MLEYIFCKVITIFLARQINFFYINIDVRVSLCAPWLILQVLKLMTM